MAVNINIPSNDGKRRKRKGVYMSATDNGGTIGLVRKCFPFVLTIMIWLTVIGATISGAVAARNFYVVKNTVKNISYGHRGSSSTSYNGNDGEKMSYTIGGGAVGLIGGLFAAVWMYGYFATILKMNENLQYLVDKEKEKMLNEWRERNKGV